MGEEDGKWIGEWVYENEVRGRCVREDRDGMTVVYDENGERRVEEWERLLWLLSCGMDPTIDFNTDSMVVYEIGEEVGVDGRCGELYDEEGKREYEGFVVNGVKMGYGKEYYSNTETVKYEGYFYDGKRFGKGVLYDRNGRIEYDGLWKNDEVYSPNSNGKTVDNHAESITIPDNSFNDVKSLIPPFFMHSLATIVIGDDCFGSARVFELDGLNALESVTIGTWSFTYARTDDDYGTKSDRSDGCCRIGNCPKLRSIRLGYRSFSDYHSFELCNLPSLQSLEIGDDCFFSATLFSLSGRRRWLCEWQIFRVFSRSSWEVTCSSMFIR